METTVEVNSLRIFARHGVFPQERAVGNEFEITVHLRYPFDPASDDLSDTASYAEIISIVREVSSTPVALLEHLAGRIRSALLSRWPLTSGGLVRVAKLRPPVANSQLASAAVTIRW